MDLFVINRYLGDSTEHKADDNEKEQLNKLLQKIEERKRNKLGEQRFRDKSFSGTIASEETNVKEPELTRIGELIQDRDENAINTGDLENLLSNENVEVDSFAVIKAKKFQKTQSLKSVLPQWLANPEIIPTNLQELSTSVDEMPGLDRDLVDKLKKSNVTHFFPVQCKLIPYLLSELRKPAQYWPRDVCVSSPTGSGKTLAFVLPIVQALRTRVIRKIRALVVLPVQDLATQVYEVFQHYCSGTDLRVLLTTGKRQFELEQKKLVKESAVNGYYSLVDILVTTPGRLVGHLQTTAGFSLKQLQFLVIDEADRVLDKIQSDWLFYLKKHISGERKDMPLSVATLQMFPRPPQQLLFSATLTQDPEKLHQLSLFQPKLFTSIMEGADDGISNGEVRSTFLGKYTTPQELSENYCVTSEAKKPVLLYHLIKGNNWKHVLCFVGSQKISHRLSLLLHHLGGGKMAVTEISAALKQAERDVILRKFAAGEIRVLVSTDALARGMDLQNVDCVVLYSVPKFVKNYIHRVGRTGRAGKSGSALSLLTESDRAGFVDMLRRAGKEITELSVSEDDLSYLSERYEAAVGKLGQDVVDEKSKVITFSKQQKWGKSSLSVTTKKVKYFKKKRKSYKFQTRTTRDPSKNLPNKAVPRKRGKASKSAAKLLLKKQKTLENGQRKGNSQNEKNQANKRNKSTKVMNAKKSKLSE